MRQEILEKNPSAPIRVYAVWISFYPWDSRSDIDSTVLSDRRVTQLWDGNKVTGPWFADQVQGHSGIAWDVYFLYGPDARWDAAPSPLLGSGSPVIGNADQLRTQLLSVPDARAVKALSATWAALGSAGESLQNRETYCLVSLGTASEMIAARASAEPSRTKLTT